MRPILVAFASLALPLPAAAQAGSWENLSPMNISRQETGAARLGNFVFVVGGLRPGFVATATAERYDIAADSWTTIAPMPAPLDHMGCVASGGKVIVTGGFRGNFVAQDEVYEYDPAMNQWTSLALMPGPRGGHWAVELDGKVYVFGGVNQFGAEQTVPFIYDVATDSWSTGSPMTEPREHLVAVELDGFIYVIGGRDGGATNINERYDPQADSWQTMAPMPTARSAPAAAAFCGRIYLMGGEVPQLFAVNESYDPTTDTWATHAPMPIPRHGIGAATLDDRILCPAGGIIQGLLPTTAVDSFIPETFTTYCTAKINSQGCVPQIGASGVASITSALPFTITADMVLNQRNGLLFYGVNGPSNTPFQGGTLCAAPPLRRTGVQGSGGNPPPSDCSGTYSFDLNAWVQGGNDPNVTAGTTVNGQYWSRDPQAVNGSGLTNAVEAEVCP